MTFKQLRDQILRLVDEPAKENPTTLDLVKDFINQAHYQRCTEHPWWFMLWPGEEQLVIVPGQHEYALHPEFHRPLYVLNSETGRYCREVPFRMIPQHHQVPAPEGASERFCYWGNWPVQQQPSQASVLTIVSSHVNDVGVDYDVVIKGEASDGSVRAEKLTPNGTTAVTGTQSFRKILGVTKAGAWNGTMTLSAGSTQLLQLHGCELSRTHRTIWFLEQGLSGETIRYRFYRKPLFLLNDYDVPDIPAPHAQLLVWDALLTMSAYLTETQASTIALWRQKQQEALLALYQAHATEGQTLEAEPTFVRVIP